MAEAPNDVLATTASVINRRVKDVSLFAKLKHFLETREEDVGSPIKKDKLSTTFDIVVTGQSRKHLVPLPPAIDKDKLSSEEFGAFYKSVIRIRRRKRGVFAQTCVQQDWKILIL